MVALSRVRLADLPGWGGGQGSDFRAGERLFTSPAILIHSLSLGNRKAERQVPRASHWAGWFVSTPSYQEPQ